MFREILEIIVAKVFAVHVFENLAIFVAADESFDGICVFFNVFLIKIVHFPLCFVPGCAVLPRPFCLAKVFVRGLHSARL